MTSLNRVILIGRLAADPEHKYTPSGIPVCQFRLCVDRPQSSEARQSGKQKETDFINCTAWRGTADFLKNYIGKGRLVSVEGRMQVNQYDKEGVKKTDTFVLAENVTALDRAPDGGQQSQDRQQGGQRPPQCQQQRPATNQPTTGAGPTGGSWDGDDGDDPFADN